MAHSEHRQAHSSHAKADFHRNLQQWLISGGEHAIRRVVDRAMEEFVQDHAFLQRRDQDMWHAIEKLQKSVDSPKSPSSVAMPAEVEGIKVRLGNLERHLLSVGIEEQVMKRLQNIDATLTETRQELLRLRTDLQSHVEAHAVEKDVVAQLEKRLVDATSSQQWVIAKQDEMRLSVAEDLIRIVTDAVHTVDDLKTSSWVVKCGRDPTQAAQIPKRPSSLPPLSISEAQQIPPTVQGAGVAVEAGVVGSEHPARIRLRTDFVSIFRTRPRFSRLLAGGSYELKLSLWDGSLFFGLRGLRKVDHLLFALAFSTNLVLQTCMCMVVFHLGNGSNKFPDSTLDALRRWRSSASEEDERGVCDVDPATTMNFLQLSTKETVDAYFDEVVFRCGPVLVRVVTLLWVATLVNLVRDLCDLTMAVVQLTDRKSSGVKLTQGVKGCIIHSIPPKRCAWMMFVALVQFTVLGILMFWGTLWLVNTTDLSELLLNAVALGFITDTDEILFKALVPCIVKGLVSRTEPLSLVTRTRCLPWRAMVSVCTVATAVVVAHFTTIADVADRLERVNGVLCEHVDLAGIMSV